LAKNIKKLKKQSIYFLTKNIKTYKLTSRAHQKDSSEKRTFLRFVMKIIKLNAENTTKFRNSKSVLLRSYNFINKKLAGFSAALWKN
jgi:hypothetical protein